MAATRTPNPSRRGEFRNCLLSLSLLLLSIAASGQGGFEKIFSMPGNSTAQPVSCGLVNGDLALAFPISSAPGTASLAICRVSAAGAMQWSRVYQTPPAFIALRISAAPDSGAVVVMLDTVQQNEVLLLRVDKSGLPAWSRKFRSLYQTLAPPPLAVLAAGDLLIATSSQDSMCLKKISAAGSILWERFYKDSSPSLVSPASLLAYKGSIFLGGYDANTYSAFLLKLDSTGAPVWQKYDLGSKSLPGGIAVKSSGGVLLCMKDNLDSPLLSEIDGQGNAAWAVKNTLVSPEFFAVSPTRLAQVAFGNGFASVLVTDTMGTAGFNAASPLPVQVNYFTACASSPGSLWLSGCGPGSIWVRRVEAAYGGECALTSFTTATQTLTLSPKNLGYASGNMTSGLVPVTVSSQALAPADSLLCMSTTGLPGETTGATVRIFPQPAGDIVRIEAPGDLKRFAFTIYTIDGVKVIHAASASAATAADTRELPAGLYMIEVKSGVRIHRQKLVIQR